MILISASDNNSWAALSFEDVSDNKGVGPTL